MRSPILALTWEMWAAHRRGYQILLGLLATCAILFHAVAGSLQRSEWFQGLSLVPMILSLGAVLFLCSHTESDAAGRSIGFPSRLFRLPVPTFVLVTCPMVIGVMAILGLHFCWVLLVFRPLGMAMPIAWPALLLAAGMLGY